MHKISKIFISITFEPNPKILSKPSEKLSRLSMLDLDLIEPLFSRKKKTEGAAELHMIDKPSLTASTRITLLLHECFNSISPLHVVKLRRVSARFLRPKLRYWYNFDCDRFPSSCVLLPFFLCQRYLQLFRTESTHQLRTLQIRVPN